MNKQGELAKQVPMLFLRGVIILIGLAVLALCVFALPAIWAAVPIEYPGDWYALYVVLTIMYAGALPFFFALFQALKLLNYIDKNKAFSMLSVKALKRIAYCGVIVAALYAASLPFFYVWAQLEDAPGLVVIGMILTLAPLTVAVFAAVMQRLLRQVIKIKSENDLTV